MPVRKPLRFRAVRPVPDFASRLAPILARSVALGLVLSLAPAAGRAQLDPGATVAWHSCRNAVATVPATASWATKARKTRRPTTISTSSGRS
ncbi:MAG: hypothetical protein INR70_18195 [Parafilimonas terrae]|nr:hypothetical protein [Parafilimonas terrae]